MPQNFGHAARYRKKLFTHRNPKFKKLHVTQLTFDTDASLQ